MILATIAGPFFAVMISIWIDWRRRARTKAAHWEILGKELEHCVAKAQWYIDGKSDAPLYRLDSPAFDKSLPALVSDAEPTANDFSVLLAFYSWVGDINRGLELAAKQPSWDTSTDEAMRIKDKCAALISEFYEPARQTLKNHNVTLRDAGAIGEAFKR